MDSSDARGDARNVDARNVDARNVDAVLSSITEHWSPRTVAVVNDYDVRVVKVQGEFTRHRHVETDEFFLVLSGCLRIRMDEAEVVLQPGDTYVVQRGLLHSPMRRPRRRCCCSSRAPPSTPATRRASSQQSDASSDPGTKDRDAAGSVCH
jgi:mannose-6-phosphate isomerase-like protein (cupin superfamily)